MSLDSNECSCPRGVHNEQVRTASIPNAHVKPGSAPREAGVCILRSGLECIHVRGGPHRTGGREADTFGAPPSPDMISKFVVITPPKATNTGRGFNRGSGGGARRSGFEERVGVYARTEGVHFQ